MAGVPCAALEGRTIPPLRLRTFLGAPVTLPRDVDAPLVMYLFPGSPHSPDDGPHSPEADVAQHRAFDRRRYELRERLVKVVGVSSETESAQLVRAVVNRVCHELWSDPELLLADELGLPTFSHEGTRCYRRMTLVLRAGRVEKTFAPGVNGERSAAQVLSWLTAVGR